MHDKRSEMLRFWSERARRYGRDPRANTNDVWLRELEIAHVSEVLRAHRPERVLDFGCANGYSTLRLAKTNPDCVITGIDINTDMIDIATRAGCDSGQRNVRFRRLDIAIQPLSEIFDLVVAIRAFQNIESLEAQCGVLDRLVECLPRGGLLLFLESYASDYERLNADREAIGLPRLPIHEHLTLLTKEFDDHVASILERVSTEHIASSYYLVTRLVYSHLAQTRGEEIDYDHPIHRIAARIPQIGDYGPLRATLSRKRGGRGPA